MIEVLLNKMFYLIYNFIEISLNVLYNLKFFVIATNYINCSLSLGANDFYFFIFEIFYVLIVILLLIFGVIYTNLKNTKNGKYFILNNGLLNLIIYIFLLLFIINCNNLGIYYTIFNNYYVSDFFIFVFKNILVVFCFFFLFLFKYYLNSLRKFDYEFIIIFLFSILSMSFILNSNDFLTLYLSIELQSLCFYVLVSSRQTASFSTEAGLKYFILGSFSSGLLLFGISLVYGFSGLLNFEDIQVFAYSLSNNIEILTNKPLFFFIENGFLLGLIFIVIAFLFKLGVAPFHMWVPDVYEGAPTIITAFLSIIPKIIIVFVFVKLFLGALSVYYNIWNYLFIVISILSIILGSIAAIYQIKIKRLLTYSMIANSGFILFGLSFNSLEGFQTILLYMVIYLIIMLGIFICILGLREVQNNLLIKKIYLLINLYNINPILAISFSLLLFSIAGIPPLLGFYGKFYIFYIGIKNAFYLITLLFIIFSIVSIFYYIRLVKLMFFNKNKYWFFFEILDRNNAIILGFITLANLIFFINPNIIFKLIYSLSLYFYL